MQSMEIPAWAWGLITMLLAGGMTMVGSILRAYTQGVDDRIKNHDKRIGRVEVDVSALKERSK